MANTKIPAIAINAAAMGALTVTTKAMAISVAMHGGKTFQTDMFCKVKTGWEGAVIGLAKVPAFGWANKRGEARVKCGNRPRARRPVTARKENMATRLA